MKRIALITAVLVLAGCGGSGSNDSTPQTPPTASSPPLTAGTNKSTADLLITGDTTKAQIDSRLSKAQGPVEVWLTLSTPALALTQVSKAEATAGAARMSRKQQNDHLSNISKQQDSVMSSLAGMGAKELGRVSRAHNAVAVRVDASKLQALAATPGILKVRPVIHYELTLSETVPYIGATATQKLGKDGTGVKVAVLDSGIDYTHKNFGGVGTLAGYQAAAGVNEADPLNTTVDAAIFPTDKVYGGFDFVGETWGVVNGAVVGTRTDDPNPIDRYNHGSHVADIIGGRSKDGTHVGVAPGVKLLAVKVCSAISSSCNGIALLKGIDYALDPNGDGDMDDAVDVINMSLGSNYGQIEDDLTEASANAVREGVIVVASAGNGSNNPYVVGSPSIGEGVISVAQTQVPSASLIPLVVSAPAAIAGVYPNVATLDWAPATSPGVSGAVSFVGRGCPAGSVAGQAAEDAYTESPAGKIALIDRGGCSVSLKVDRAAKAGATGVLIGLIAPGDAVGFSNGGGTTFVPSLVIQQSLSKSMKTALTAGPVTVTISKDKAISLVGSMASTSSRGPSVSGTLIKPEIGAPGASLSALAGSGDKQTTFGGTSGAAPMVAGAAAILRQAYPDRSPIEIKAMLMNSAETKIYTNPAAAPGALAPITRIGAGEVRVDRALALNAAAWESKTKSAALSFGFQAVSRIGVFEREIRVKNFSNAARTYTVASNFRYDNDKATGAVQVIAQPVVLVPARGTATVKVIMTVNASKLPDWVQNGGKDGGNSNLFELNEFDGYITLTGQGETLSLPWHILPRKSADLRVASRELRAGSSILVSNLGVAPGLVDVFSLTGVSPEAEVDKPEPGSNKALIDMRAVGVRLAAPGIAQFAINTFGARSTPLFPAEFDILVDTDRDGKPDFLIFNGELADGGRQSVIAVRNLTTNVTTPVAFNDVDFNSANAIFTVPLTALGLAEDATFDFTVEAYDNYFTGELTDTIAKMTYTLSKPKFTGVGLPDAGVAPASASLLKTAAVAGGDVASPSQAGLLLMYRSQAGKREAEIIKLR